MCGQRDQQVAKRLAIIYDRRQLLGNEFFLESLIEAARNNGLEASVRLAQGANLEGSLAGFDAAIIRSRSVTLRLTISVSGIPLVINSPLLALVGNDKLAQDRFLWRNGIPRIPCVRRVCPRGDYVVKPRFGHGGAGVRRLRDSPGGLAGLDSFVLQPFMPDADHDIRTWVIGDEQVASVDRFSERDFRANLSLGASVAEVDLPLQARSLVKRLIELLGPGYYGVDLIRGSEGYLVSEIEDLVGSRSLYMLGIADPADRLMRWIRGRDYRFW